MIEFYKENPTDRVWWADVFDIDEEDIKNGKIDIAKEIGDYLLRGPLIISFDKNKTYDLWVDYPHNMTAEEVELFDKENPYWADFFKSRKSDK